MQYDDYIHNIKDLSMIIRVNSESLFRLLTLFELSKFLNLVLASDHHDECMQGLI